MATGKVVSVILEAKAQGFVAGVNTAKKSLTDLTAAGKVTQRDAFDNLSTKAAVAGGAIAVGIGVAVKKFAEFDSAMSAVQANSGATGAELDSLRQIALDLGADTQFSATEAADGINELAKAGVSTADILGGGLKGSLDLAAAGQIGVGEAAETAATAMTQFGLEGSEIPHVADLMTNAANKAQGGVGDLAQALKQGGLVAASTGLTIDETTASLAAFASAGLIGSDAGTSLKTMLQRLSAPVGKAAETMDELGISAYDASGEFVGMEALSGQLRTALEDLTPAQRNAALATMFGSDAVRAANILYAEGADGMANWTAEVTEQGAAAKQAAILTDNLQGDVERLGGALDTAFIQTGSSANGAARTLVQGVSLLVDGIGKIPGPALLAGGALTSMLLMAPKGISAYRDIKANLDAVGLSMETIANRGPRAAEGMYALDRGARAAAKGLAVLAAARAVAEAFQDDTLAVGPEELAARSIEAADAVGVLNKALEENAVKINQGDATVRDFGTALRVAFDPSWMDSFAKGNAALWDTVTFGLTDIATTAKEADDAFSLIDGQLTSLVSDGKADEAARLFGIYATKANAAGVSTDDLAGKLPGYREAAAKAGLQAKETGDDTSGMADQMTEAEEAVDGLADAIKSLGEVLLQQEASQDGYEASLDAVTASIKENGRTLDESTEKGRANRKALRDLANSTQEWAAAELNATGNVKNTQKILDEGRAAWIRHRDALGANKTETRNLADELFKIDDLKPKAKVDVATEEASQKTKDFQALITGTDSMLAKPTVEEQGATESKGRVIGLRDAIFGVKGKDVGVTEHGATPAKSRVLGLDDQIINLDGKTVTVKEEGASPSTKRIGQMDQSIANIDGKTVTVTEIGSTAAGGRVVSFKGKIYEVPTSRTANVTANVNGTGAVDSLRNSISAVQSKTVTITTIARKIGTLFADGGIADQTPMGLTQSFADGGFASIGSQQPQIRAAGGAGITWAEDGAGPWEGFVSGHPAKRNRSRVITGELANRLGGEVVWHKFADGGVLDHASRTYVAPQPRATAMQAAPVSAPPVDSGAIAAAVGAAMSGWQPMVEIGGQKFHGLMKRTNTEWKGRA